MTRPASLFMRRASDLLEATPAAYRAAMILRHRNAPFLRRIVSSRHDIVIDAFPRSASSFAVSAFMFSNGWRDPRVATHVHSPAQIVLAVRWERPTLVLIRQPGAAVVSLLALLQQSGSLDPGRLSRAAVARWVGYQTSRYAQFYERIEPLRDGYVLAGFEETTRDFGAVIRRVNERFGTDFDVFDSTDENVKRIFARSGSHLAPDNRRESLKHVFEDIYASDRNRVARERAERAYARAMASGGA